MTTCDKESATSLCNDAPAAERILHDDARVFKGLVSLLSPSVAIPEGNCNSSSNVWEKLINPDETRHAIADPLATTNREYCLDSKPATGQ
ncbi:MAG: hypothetical protein QOH31_699 [Verrucomicrobiota bacterium]